MGRNYNLKLRKSIYDYIFNNPGVHLSDIASTFNLSIQLIDYHISSLEKRQLIDIVKDDGYKRCFIYGDISDEERRVLAVLRQEIPLQIVGFLLKNPYARHRDLLNHFDIPSPNLSYHLRKLVKNNIIVPTSQQEERGYIIRNKTPKY